MNWYKIFYWLTVADNVSVILSVVSISTLVLCVISFIGYFVSTNSKAEHSDTSHYYNQWHVWVKAWRTVFLTSIIICVISSISWSLVPSRKDALVIVAGGAIGNFVTTDSSAKQIPHEALDLVRAKLKEWQTPGTSFFDKDTLVDKSKEELIEIIKQKK